MGLFMLGTCCGIGLMVIVGLVLAMIDSTKMQREIREMERWRVR